MDDQEPLAADRGRCLLADRLVRGDKGGQNDGSCVVEQSGDFGTTAKVLASFVGGEAQVLTDSAAHVLAVEHDNGPALVEEPPLDRVGECCFAATRQAGKQDGYRLLAEAGLALA